MKRADANRDEILKLIHWYETPQSGVIDREAWNIAKPIMDALKFKLASLDSGMNILTQPTTSFFGVERPRYPDHGEVSDSLLLKREKMALARRAQQIQK